MSKMVSPIDIDSKHVKRMIEIMSATFVASILLDIIKENENTKRVIDNEEGDKNPTRKIPVRVQKVVDAL